MAKSPKAPKPKNEFHELCKVVVGRTLYNLKKISWGREIKIAKQLLEMYPDAEFWHKMEFPYKPASLAYFLTPKGGEELNKLMTLFKYNPIQKPAESEAGMEKVGEDKIFVPSKKTMLDFLK